MQTLVYLALLLAPFYALFRVTEWCCPWAADISRMLGRAVLRLVRRAGRAVWRLTWSSPAQTYGTATTIWFWLVAVAVASTLAALVGWRLESLHSAIVWWLLVLGGWWLLRRRALRRHRPRVLPARHERR